MGTAAQPQRDIFYSGRDIYERADKQLIDQLTAKKDADLRCECGIVCNGAKIGFLDVDLDQPNDFAPVVAIKGDVRETAWALLCDDCDGWLSELYGGLLVNAVKTTLADKHWRFDPEGDARGA